MTCFYGYILISNSVKIKSLLNELLRSNKAAIFLLSLGLFWFQFQHVRNLGEADFGDYKLIELISLWRYVWEDGKLNDEKTNLIYHIRGLHEE